MPAFIKIFNDFEVELPLMTTVLIGISEFCVHYFYLIPGIPLCLWLFVKLIRKFKQGRVGWDMWCLKMPIFGQLVEKNIMARTTRTLGTLVASGVPILEALNITRDTAGNAVFETLYGKVIESIREGESISKPLKDFSRPGFHPVAMFFWGFFLPVIGFLMYLGKMNARVVDDLVVNCLLYTSPSPRD